ncbi:MAG: 50S ribosomal protein L24 [Alphaproteobacteria bacterium MarineAlpha9_Bin1]|nr:MAG: 50S ribosomal protein L24 [Alphaproteobacteria bacterium MarineAlpha9_Bin1]
MTNRLKVKKGDKVIVISGRDKGKSGEVLSVIKKSDRILVRGVNIVKRHTAPSQTSQGGIIDKEISIHISNIAHIDPKDNKATRVGYKFLEDGRKVRFSKRSEDLID